MVKSVEGHFGGVAKVSFQNEEMFKKKTKGAYDKGTVKRSYE